MADNPQVTFEPEAWGQRIEDDLAYIADATPRDLAAFRHLVESGKFKAWGVFENGRRVGSVIWCIEREPDGHAYVINAAAVRGPTETDVTEAMFQAFATLAKGSGARAIRCWTERPGLVRKLEARGARRKNVLEVLL